MVIGSNLALQLAQHYLPNLLRMHMFKTRLATTSMEKLTIQFTWHKSWDNKTTWVLQHLFKDFALEFLVAMMLMPSIWDYMDFNIVTTTSKFKPILLTSNLFRATFNCSCAKLFAIQRESPPIQFHACVTRGHCSIISVLEHWSLKCSHNETSRLPMILELVVGMPIMCTKNNSRPTKVANGTLGHVIGYLLAKIATTHHQVIDETSKYTTLVSPTLLEMVFIKLFSHDQI